MTGPGSGRPAGGWRGALPEVGVAAVAVAAAAAAGYALAGPAAVTIVIVVAMAAALGVIRLLLPAAQPPPPVDGGTDSITTGWSAYRYWRNLADLREGIATRAAYDRRLRPALEHLLAARLAERHGVNLYRDPDAARRLLCRPGRDQELWAWIDPAGAGQAGDRDGPGGPGAAGAAGAAGPAGAAGRRGARRGGAQPPGIPLRTLERLINRLEQL